MLSTHCPVCNKVEITKAGGIAEGVEIFKSTRGVSQQNLHNFATHRKPYPFLVDQNRISKGLISSNSEKLCRDRKSVV